MTQSFILALSVVIVAACGRGDGGVGDYDAGTVSKRVFHPRPGRVRAMPPHDIQPDGIGPYKLGASLRAVFELLPHGPRVELLHIAGVLECNLVRTEGGGLLIGTERDAAVTFVAAIVREIAKTEAGAVIGIPVGQLSRFGNRIDRGAVRDPSLEVRAHLDSTWIVTDLRRVTAVVVSSHVGATPVPPTSCPGEDAMLASLPGVLATAGAGTLPRPRVATGCFDDTTPVAVVAVGDRIVVVTGSATAQPGGGEHVERLRRFSVRAISGLMFAGPLDVDGDGRAEVVAVSRQESAKTVSYRVHIHRTDMTPIVETTVYELEQEAVAWVGAERLEDTSLLLEVVASQDGARVGGVYTQLDRTGIRNVLPLKPRQIAVRQRGLTAGSDAGPPPARHDAGPPAPPR